MKDDKFKQLDHFIKKYYNNEKNFLRLIDHVGLIASILPSWTKGPIGASVTPTKMKQILKNESAKGWIPEGLATCTPSLLHEKKDESSDTLQNRINQIKNIDKFQPFLMYLMNIKQLDTVDVYKNSMIDRRTFSKIKSDEDYHPKKLTALCLCIGLKLNLDQAKDLLMRAGYSFSSTDLTDIIFLYFIENKNYDIFAVDEALMQYNLPTITKID